MNIKYHKKLKNENYLNDIFKLLVISNNEFVPPLTTRKSTTQSKLKSGEYVQDAPIEYFKEISSQPIFIIEDEGKVIAFMAIKKTHLCDEISITPNVYITTVVTDPAYRNHGLVKQLYRKVIDKFNDRDIFVRTWSTNYVHIHILNGLGFDEYARIPNDRGERIDTIYFHFKKHS